MTKKFSPRPNKIADMMEGMERMVAKVAKAPQRPEDFLPKTNDPLGILRVRMDHLHQQMRRMQDEIAEQEKQYVQQEALLRQSGIDQLGLSIEDEALLCQALYNRVEVRREAEDRRVMQGTIDALRRQGRSDEEIIAELFSLRGEDCMEEAV